MRKLFIITSLSFLPLCAFAADVSDCTVVGHKIYTQTVESCMTPPEICKTEPDSPKCLNNTKAADECAAEIAEINQKMTENYLVFRCPVNEERLAKLRSMPISADFDYVDINGVPVDIESMQADTESIYIFRRGAGLAGGFTYVEPYADYILVQTNPDGFNLALYD